MMSTKIIPTDKYGSVYYGPRTFGQAVEQIDAGRPWPQVATMVADAGYDGVARRIRREYGVTVCGCLIQHDVCGCLIQHDESGGQGHCWRVCDAMDCQPSVQLEIECEIIDGKRESCSDYVASNGQHYRW